MRSAVSASLVLKVLVVSLFSLALLGGLARDRDGADAVPFNGGGSSMPTVDSASRLCGAPAPHPGPVNVLGDFFPCADVLGPPGALVNLRQKLQIGAGNVLTSPQMISYTSGLMFLGPPGVGAAVGEYNEDIDW